MKSFLAQMDSHGSPRFALRIAGPSKTLNFKINKNHGMATHKNINKFGGLARNWVGGKIIIMCFFRPIFREEEEEHINNIPHNPRTIW